MEAAYSEATGAMRIGNLYAVYMENCLYLSCIPAAPDLEVGHSSEPDTVLLYSNIVITENWDCTCNLSARNFID